jgi:hypothetical protein
MHPCQLSHFERLSSFRYATEANKQVQRERLQGEEAAAIEKRRAADAVLKVSITSDREPDRVSRVLLQRLSSVSLVFDRAAAAGLSAAESRKSKL